MSPLYLSVLLFFYYHPREFISINLHMDWRCLWGQICVCIWQCEYPVSGIKEATIMYRRNACSLLRAQCGASFPQKSAAFWVWAQCPFSQPESTYMHISQSWPSWSRLKWQHASELTNYGPLPSFEPLDYWIYPNRINLHIIAIFL